MQITFSSYGSVVALTPSDTAPVNCRAIYVGGIGNVAIKSTGSAAAVTFTAPPVGTIIPVNIDGGQVMATGTTATLLLALS